MAERYFFVGSITTPSLTGFSSLNSAKIDAAVNQSVDLAICSPGHILPSLNLVPFVDKLIIGCSPASEAEGNRHWVSNFFIHLAIFIQKSFGEEYIRIWVFFFVMHNIPDHTVKTTM